MKAVVATPRGAELREVPAPSLAPEECVVRVRAALVTPADRRAATCAADGRETGRVLGQAFVGTVDAVHADVGPDSASAGNGDARRWIGTRVAAHPVTRCGRCDRCVAGLAAHCRERRILGIEGRAGGLAERVGVPLANLVAVPEGLDDESAVFGVTVAEALEATKLVRVEGKAFITVLGEDILALVTGQVMSKLNATVRIVADHPATVAAAEKSGLRHRLADETGRRGDQHVVIDCVGSAESLAFAAQLVRARGTIILKSPGSRTRPAVGADLAPLVENELRVQGCAYGPLHEALDLLTRRGIDVAGLIERRVPLLHAADWLSETPMRLGVVVRV